MTREEMDGWDAVIRDHELTVCAEHQVTDAIRTATQDTHYIGESMGYRCDVEGCASDPAYPEHACPNCRAVHAIEQQRAAEDRAAEDVATGKVCVECGSPFIRQYHRPTRCRVCGGDGETAPWFVCGQYFSEPASADAARARYIAKRNRLAERMARVEAAADTEAQGAA